MTLRRFAAGAFLLSLSMAEAAEGQPEHSELMGALRRLGANEKTMRLVRAVEDLTKSDRRLDALDLLPGVDPQPLDLLLTADISLQTFGSSVAAPWLERIAALEDPLAATAALLRAALADQAGPRAFNSAIRSLRFPPEGTPAGITATVAFPRITLVCRTGPGGSPLQFQVVSPQEGVRITITSSSTASVWEMPGEPPWSSMPVWLVFEPIRGLRRDGRPENMEMKIAADPTPIAHALASGNESVQRLADRLVWSMRGDTWIGRSVLGVAADQPTGLSVEPGDIGFKAQGSAISVRRSAPPLIPIAPTRRRSLADSLATAMQGVLEDQRISTRAERRSLIPMLYAMGALRDLQESIRNMPRLPAQGRRFADPLLRLVYDDQERMDANPVLSAMMFDADRLQTDSARGIDLAITEGSTRAVIIRRWIADASARRTLCERLIEGRPMGDEPSPALP